MAAERFGCLAVRENAQTAMTACRDPEQLSAMALDLLRSAEKAHNRKNDEMAGTYQFLYYALCDHARDNLSREGYHRFCEQQAGVEYYLLL